MTKLRILQVCGTGEGGQWFLWQVRELLSRGHSVDVVIPAEGRVATEIRSMGIDPIIIPFRGYRPSDMLRLLRSLNGLRSLLRSNRYDIVHAHLFKAIFMCRIAHHGHSSPILVSQITGVVHLDIPWLRILDRLTVGLDDVTVVSCAQFATIYANTRAENVRVNHYGIDEQKFLTHCTDITQTRAQLGLTKDDVAIGMVAHMYPSNASKYRLVGVKGHEVFLDAARICLAQRPNTRFFVVGDEFVGDGSYRASLEARVADLPGFSIKFLGHRDDVASLVASMDILANPSLSESASYTMMEASLSSKPVVASRVGGLTDTVLAGRTGLLVPPRDAEALAEALITLADDPEMRSKLGAAGQQHILRSMTLVATVDNLERIYAEALA